MIQRKCVGGVRQSTDKYDDTDWVDLRDANNLIPLGHAGPCPGGSNVLLPVYFRDTGRNDGQKPPLTELYLWMVKYHLFHFHTNNST
jgi:hypothetical protein